MLLTAAFGLLLAPGTAAAAFTSTGSLSAARSQAGAVALPGGATTTSVVAIGGVNTSGTPLQTAERYDVAAGTWSAAAPPTIAHGGQHTLLLPSGNIFVVGGQTLIRGVSVNPTQQPEQYDPVKDAWDASAIQPAARLEDAASISTFRGSQRVFTAGGVSTGGATLKTVDVYDPVADAWAGAPDMAIERRSHAAVGLPDGRLLVAGGFNANGAIVATTEIYNPGTNSWSAGPTMSVPRAQFTLSLVDGTHLLAAGGVTTGGGAVASSEVLDPTQVGGTWQPAGSMAVARATPQATVVRSGWVVLSGGANAASLAGISSAESWTPGNGWGGLYNLPGESPIGGARLNHFAAPIPQSDTVLIGGGGTATPDNAGTAEATAVRWTPDQPVVPTTPAPTTPTSEPQPQPQQPVEGRTFVAGRASGKIFIRIGTTDEYRELTEDESVPFGTVIDATDGHVRVTAVVNGVLQTAEFWGGTFIVSQAKDGWIEVRLYGTLKCKNGKPVTSTSKKAVRLVKRKSKPKAWGDGKGKFRTKGVNSTASVRGTKWLVEERCTGTFTKVARGVVSVRDFTKHKTVTVKAGKNYLARPRR